MAKVEVYTISIEDKESKKEIKFEKTIAENLWNGIYTKFPNYILDAPPKETHGDIVKVFAEDEKTLWKGQSSYGRVSGIIVVGRDRDKMLRFSNPDEQKTDAGEKIKGLSVDKKHYFEIILPKNKSTGYLVLERTDGKSYKKHITSLLQGFIPTIQPGLKVNIDKFIEKTLIKKFLSDGSYSQLEFVRKAIPSNTLDSYLGDYKNNGTYTLKTAIVPEDSIDFPNSLKKELVKAIENEETFFSIPQWEELGFEKGKTSLKVTSTYNGTVRTIDLSNTMRIQPIYDIDIDLEEDGFVDYEEMRKKVNELLDSFNLDII